MLSSHSSNTTKMDPEKRLTIEAITTATAPSPKPVVESNSGDFLNLKEIVLRETTARFKEGKSVCISPVAQQL